MIDTKAIRKQWVERRATNQDPQPVIEALCDAIDEIYAAPTTWTAAEVRALREAQWMTVREFAEHLGVSKRTAARWESGAAPSLYSQEALGVSLARVAPHVRGRFTQFLAAARR